VSHQQPPPSQQLDQCQPGQQAQPAFQNQQQEQQQRHTSKPPSSEQQQQQQPSQQAVAASEAARKEEQLLQEVPHDICMVEDGATAEKVKGSTV